MDQENKIPAVTEDLLMKSIRTKKSSIALSQSSDEQRCQALLAMADALSKDSSKIIEQNSEDIERSQRAGLSNSLISRLKLDEAKLNDSIEGLKKVAFLSDPLGKVEIDRELADGLFLQRLTVPLGVVGVIFESRPDALIQIASLAIRSGNSAILKGGSEANLTNLAIMSSLIQGLEHSQLPSDSLCLLTTRQESLALLHLEKYIDLIIPRGSNELVRFIQENTKIPVLGHADGICHLYIDSKANLEHALEIAIDSKCQYPAACNSIETLLLHEDIAAPFLSLAIPAFEKLGVLLLGDEMSQSHGILHKVSEIDWSSEYLDLKLSIKVVSHVDEAINHIRLYGSMHTDAIVTTDSEVAKKFMFSVDSSGVFHNCSTRFADGFRYGFGAEVGISTQSLPPRGPVGLDGLVTYRYFVKGNGHIVSDFSSGLKTFTHKDLSNEIKS